MQNTKKISLSLILMIGLMIPTIQSCKKYPDGPAISLRSRAERVSNTWKVEKYMKNNIDETGDFMSSKLNYIEIFTKEKSWSYIYTNSGDSKIKSGGGTWQFYNHDKQILRVKDNEAQMIFILKLKENEFWYYYMDGNDIKEFHLTSN